MAIPTKTRNVAKKYSISKILLSRFVVSQNFEEPNYILIDEKSKAFRVNVIGTIIEKNDFNGKVSLTIDDGSSIQLKSFNDTDLSNFEIGTVVNVIGRPRQNNNGVFIAIETISKIDSNWINVRKKELIFYEKLYLDLDKEFNDKDVNKNSIIDNSEKEEKIEINKTSNIENSNDTKSIYSEILKIIESLDKGEGANFIDVLNKLKSENIDLEKSELMINKMILDGDIFEISGNLKISK